MFGRILLGVWVLFLIFMALFMAFPFAVARLLRHVEPLGHVIYWLPFVLIPVTVFYAAVRVFRRSMRLAKERKRMSRDEVADLVERFLEDRPAYPGEWYDFVEGRRLENGELETIRKRLYELDPLVNCPGEQDPKAIAELKSIVAMLRFRPEGTERK